MSTDDRSLGTPIMRGLRSRCPGCGEGRLFQGFLTLRPSCERCGLDYSFADAADGPAVFVIMISGFIVVFAALAVEFAYQPPYWVHAALWLAADRAHHAWAAAADQGRDDCAAVSSQGRRGRLSRGE